TPRAESDTVTILSGTEFGVTLGTPIGLMVPNKDQRPGDYAEMSKVPRPSHADFTYQEKYGIRDHRGGGRSSGRETVGRVAAGAVAAKFLARSGIEISAKVEEVHGVSDPGAMEEEIRKAKQSGDSVGGIIRISATGVPPGLGDPVFGKLDAQIAGAMMGIGAVKGVEIGDGFASARLKGSEHNDPMDGTGFLSNHAGGILGGISNGNEIVVRIAVKPTASIALPQKTRSVSGDEQTISVKGRHDPCIVPRLMPVAEAMLALVLFDTWLEQEKYRAVIQKNGL
ncbi:MAG TPA: chorismate synthase, partial [Methanoregulaceae archaeon]|nr:chorismate synthase [Methanoregulaceae archaeon]